MMPLHELSYRIADLAFHLKSPDETVGMRLDNALLPFACRGASADVRIAAHWSDLSGGAVKGKKIFDPGLSWKLYEEEDAYLFAIHSSMSGSVPYKIARMTRDFSNGEVLLHTPFFNPNEPLFPLSYPLDEILFVRLLSLGRGAHLHACGIVDGKGYGHLFIGQSGAGKSTIARLLAGLPASTILSDDRIAVRMKKGEPWIFGTPWHGDVERASPDSAPLRTIFFLAKDGINRLVPLPGASVVGRLLACSFPPFFDPSGLDFTLSFFDDMSRAVPCYELRFRPDNDVLRLVEGLVVKDRFAEGPATGPNRSAHL